jgi:hypothetical protein
LSAAQERGIAGCLDQRRQGLQLEGMSEIDRFL